MKIFFDHIPKTAGMSMHQFFIDAFGVEAVSAIILGLKLQNALRMYSAKKVLTGHIEIMPGDRIPDNYLSLTLLRDPRERALSLFYFIKNNVPEAGLKEEEKVIKFLSLEKALYNDYFVKQITNTQSRHFASYFHESPKQLSPKELFNYAKRGIDQYDFVGVSECINEFVEAIKFLFDLPASLGIKRVNVTSGQTCRYKDLPMNLRQRIDELTDTDMLLWDHAQNLFELKKNNLKQIISAISKRGELGLDETFKSENTQAHLKTGYIELLKAYFVGQLRSNSNFICGELVELHVVLRSIKEIRDIVFSYSVHHDSDINMFSINTKSLGNTVHLGPDADFEFVFTFPVNLGIGKYYLNILAYTGASHPECCYLLRERVAAFSVIGFMHVQFEGFVNMTPYIKVSVQNNNDNALLCIHEEPKKGCVIGEYTPPVSIPKGAIKLTTIIDTACPSSQLIVPLIIINNSDKRWVSSGKHPVFISYHWQNLDRSNHHYDGLRTPLPMGGILPGMKVAGTAIVETPASEGIYILEMTLVQEGICWFENKGFESCKNTISLCYHKDQYKTKQSTWRTKIVSFFRR